MSDRSSGQALRPRRTFTPGVKRLEDRFLLSSAQRSSLLVPQAVKHDGNAVQTGTLLGVTADRSGTNKVHVTDNGAGFVQVDWNGSSVHSFAGIDTVDVHTQKGKKDVITFGLTGGPSVALDDLARPPGEADSRLTPGETLHPLIRVLKRTSQKDGVAVQSGTVLTVTVHESKGNSVQISDKSGDILVAWNGGSPESFEGINAIVVNAQKARNDQVIFTEPT
jgi:hypothetical protein